MASLLALNDAVHAAKDRLRRDIADVQQERAKTVNHAIWQDIKRQRIALDRALAEAIPYTYDPRRKPVDYLYKQAMLYGGWL